MKDPKDETPVSYGLNSRLVKRKRKVDREGLESRRTLYTGY